MKAVSFQVQPISVSSAMTTYVNSFKIMMQPEQKKARARFGLGGMKNTPRKFKVHINQ